MNYRPSAFSMVLSWLCVLSFSIEVFRYLVYADHSASLSAHPLLCDISYLVIPIGLFTLAVMLVNKINKEREL